ncbi:hypothetical protein SAMD00019534_079280 [Acytostelium subglobosum LB1]|uniref:hypothetical protein n=1 Tax=Acytostelium subglobosum LB1 TaxID=1410327 RepID=UPI0006448FF9|nr:hypothetical protein SAMD00019534_079280 [Acytostelium subglobosum LB1]GAM24753.1 hypothetical protein SAMD00019534_079280 [Acytostelium subglobosum LB1]|eukprot:XP_012752422.1 hypothetical protein SAMD00019534_079280 [Acytostelium subglobosum LB1]
MVNYHILQADSLTDDQIQQCANLFSTKYGVWSKHVQPPLQPGKNVRLTANKLKKQFLFDDQCYASLAIDNGEHVGHALYRVFSTPELGEVRWITQLVVKREHRHRGIGQQLVYNCLGTTWRAAGLASCNPYAVKALERASGLKCNLELSQQHGPSILQCSNLSYLPKEVDVHVNALQSHSYIDTNYFVDHDEVLDALNKVDIWRLGDNLPEGYEFLHSCSGPVCHDRLNFNIAHAH